MLFPLTDDTHTDGGDGLTKYWGPLISQGGNGPSAKPLFTSFKTEGHVSTACLWHACRAVTIGSLLIILGITMAVLGKTSTRGNVSYEFFFQVVICLN